MSAGQILAPWANFYLMIGPAAAGLTGLMFVVVTLITNTERVQRSPDGIGTFSTPTVFHFAGVLVIAAVMLAPWRVISHPAIVFTVSGLIGMTYVSWLVVRTIRLDDYRADLEDWAWYNLVPLLGYTLIFAGGLLLFWSNGTGMFLLGAAAVAFILAGIHNAWDIVTYLTLKRPGEDGE